jgi:hypothetical protein
MSGSVRGHDPGVTTASQIIIACIHVVVQGSGRGSCKLHVKSQTGSLSDIIVILLFLTVILYLSAILMWLSIMYQLVRIDH